MNVDTPHAETYNALRQAWRDRPTWGPIRIAIAYSAVSVVAGFVTTLVPYQGPILAAYIAIGYAALRYRYSRRSLQADYRRHVTRPYCRTFYVHAWRIHRRGSWRCQDCRRWHPIPNCVDAEGLHRWVEHGGFVVADVDPGRPRVGNGVDRYADLPPVAVDRGEDATA